MTARRSAPGMKFTWRMPRTVRSFESSTFIGPGDGAVPGRRLREGGRTRGVEGDIALDLLHHLVDVAVEHGDRAELLQHPERLLGILRAPSPIGIDRPERNMGEDDDRRARGARGDVGLQPGELIGTEIAHARRP